MNGFRYIITEKDNNRTIETILKNELKISSTLIKKMKHSELIRLSGKPAWVIDRVKTGDLLEADFPQETSAILPQEGEIKIVYEDEALLIVDKSPGMVVHPTMNHVADTLVNYVAFYLNKRNQTGKIRPVNRLDRDTSGLVIIAKDSFSHEFLSRQMHAKTLYKEYLGVVCGIPEQKEGTINLPIARKEGSLMERVISPEGQASVTHFVTVNVFPSDGAALIKYILETGRTHQIRIHSAASGFPLIGDTLYGNSGCPQNSCIERQALHCSRMAFINPMTKQQQQVEAQLPEDIKILISSFKNASREENS